MALHFVLDANQVGRPFLAEPSTAKRPAQFKISLASPYSPYDVHSDPFNAQAGTSTRVRVTPNVKVSADGLQGGLSIAQRECRFRDENENMKLFSNYSLVGCRFECMLENAHEVCGCTPWNYPYIASGNIEICDMFGSHCFAKRMGDVQTGESCNCESDW